MSYQEPPSRVPILKEDLPTVDSLRSIIVTATLELERITNRTLKKSEQSAGKKKTTVIFTIPAENDRDDVEWETDGEKTCIDHKAKVCCSGPCPC